MNNVYMSNPRVLATLLVIPRMTEDTRSEALILKLPLEAQKLGRALAKKSSSGLDSEEEILFKTLLNRQ